MRRIINNANLHTDEIEILLASEREDSRQADFFSLQEKIERFRLLWPEVREKCRELGISSEDAILVTFWRLWLTVAIELRDSPKPFVQGILAPQGTGKTTLTVILRLILQSFGVRAIGLSIDDLYKTYSERLQLREADPRLRWRGPPGTHDIESGIETLDRFRNRERSIAIPRFNKASHGGQGDRIDPEIVGDIDIILFEGWFLGVRPVGEEIFDSPPDPIVTAEDRAFARDCNRRLRDYIPLWERIDRLLILYPLDYRWSLQWRKTAEPAGGMRYTEIEEFVKYFWKSLHPEIFLPPMLDRADRVVKINRDRSIGAIKSRIIDV
ncbi:glycerate kinase [Pannus brasiliensis CCIBt3594]|uniref:Glycerate kinase n=1 Tax=Pannus brasiliensis CCIBt3594 TaxID=1427578 RepID=A0AAW9QVJ0_9CHRO